MKITPLLCAVAMVGITHAAVPSKKFTPLVYVLNTRGELFYFANNVWNKVDALPKTPSQAARTIISIAAGPSIIKDNSNTGQLYAIDNSHGLFGMYGISEQTPGGNGEWKVLSDPRSTPICGIAAGQFKLLAFLCSGSSWVWQKSCLATRGVADIGTIWQPYKDTDAASVAVRPDADNENNETLFHIGYHYRFLIWERGYNNIFYKNPTDTGWIQAAGALRYIYAGVQGSIMGVNKDNMIFAASPVSQNPTWINIEPPSTYQAAQLDPKLWEIKPHKDHELFKLAMGIATDTNGNVINEIWLSGIFVCRHRITAQDLMPLGKKKSQEYTVRSMIWRRANVTLENKFGTEWQLIAQQTDDNEPRHVMEIAICSLDQTQEYLKALKDAEASKQRALEKQKKAAEQKKKQKDALEAKETKRRAEKAAARQVAAEKARIDAAREAKLRGAKGIQEKERSKTRKATE
jgi:hypothetical protein